MSETIGEMILPGTYIDVRAEGLIGVGGISTGNVGIVGTANRGPVDEVRILGSYGEALDTFGAYDSYTSGTAITPGAPALTLVRALEQLFAGGASSVFAVRIGDFGVGTPPSTTWSITFVDSAVDNELFKLTARTPGTWANDIQVTCVKSGGVATLQLKYGRFKEEFVAATAGALATAVNAGSALVSANAPVPAEVAMVPDKATITNATSNGAAFTNIQITTGLGKLANQPVNIVVVAGATTANLAPIQAHLEATENDGKERLAVLGAASDDPQTIGSPVSNARILVTAPGIVADDAADSRAVTLPASYTAALIAGRLASLAPHVSLTNKDVPVAEVSKEYTRAEQKVLLGNRILALKKDLGIRVLKGITTDTGAFKQISVRRIVDYAKAGVRVGSNPYIGKLNNARVRAALQATLDGFLSGMVLDEMLTAYTLQVSATRQQEINGIALVTMTLQPTFSIDFVKVIMNLE
ncbi:phage tail sheath C-terminal domain-containing protein [Hyalangium sp.]|uniref:phage tail sheath C-terminal domain-containing protein n=1 Tax=Hyalangium sp. TaxID=2028555 RepID=UPI002D31E0C8|nr:phage tail sheath C-terminal domain-containing protein [Hyalangium sp.]HYI00861.1 phage tail sheath C-terminal domain-containing protein [Hyalangium sp.]